MQVNEKQNCKTQVVIKSLYQEFSLYVSHLLLVVLFLETVSLCRPGWSATAQSQLTAASASWVQAILLPHHPKYLILQACANIPG